MDANSDTNSCYHTLHGSLGWRFLNKETFGPLGTYTQITRIMHTNHFLTTWRMRNLFMYNDLQFFYVHVVVSNFSILFQINNKTIKIFVM